MYQQSNMHRWYCGSHQVLEHPTPQPGFDSHEVEDNPIVRTKTSSVGICLAPRGYMGVMWWWPRNLPALSF